MHLKNFSLLYEPDGMIRLSPACDLLPTRLLMPQDKEEMALTVNGRKANLRQTERPSVLRRSRFAPKPGWKWASV